MFKWGNSYYLYILSATVFFIGLFAGWNSSQAQERNTSRQLPWVTYMSRSQRWADESRRYMARIEFQNFLHNRKKHNEYLETLKQENIEQYLEETRKSYELQIADDYLTENFGDKFTIDAVTRTINTHDLRRSQTYKDNKTQLLIHHTVHDRNNINSIEDEKNLMKQIYQFHTFTRGRGDIGYNFIIGPSGTIYEWRAGWPGIVAAHAKYNNVPSVGISLMGNFEINQPTPEQIKALINLSTSLAYYYDIDPFARWHFHTQSSEYPYVDNHEHYNLAWHRDAGTTSCPGHNLYEILPWVRKAVAWRLEKMYQFVERTSDKPKIEIIKNTYLLHDKIETITIPVWLVWTNATCSSLSENLLVTSCSYDRWNQLLTLTLGQKKWAITGIRPIQVTTEKDNYILQLSLVWTNEIAKLLTHIKERYITNNGELPTKKPMSKIQKKISLTDIKELITKKVHVLLYELSTEFDTRPIRCPDWCILNINGKDIDGPSQFIVSKVIKNDADPSLSIRFQWKEIASKSLSIRSKREWWTVIFAWYTRTSYAWIPRNSFQWTIDFRTQSYIDYQTNNTKRDITITNNLSLSNYLQWIVETNDTESIEKNKVMTLLAKNYVLFYMDEAHQHPFVPNNVTYNAIDDPRMFQKYVGAGVKETLTLRSQALFATRNMVVLYDNHLAFLPYFNCSAWFTRSAQEKRWRKDTPYLQSKIDIAQCTNFNGHGVWLSGKWATILAQKWVTMKNIIQYYYDNVTIESR